LINEKYEDNAMTKLPLLLLAAMSLSLSTAIAQTSTAVVYSPDQLIQLADEMREQVKPSKEPSTGILEKHLDTSTILAFRDRDGKAEMHEQFGDVFVVLRGTATLVTGGTIASPTTTAPGEIRGVSVQEGVRKKLQEGDIVHIPAGIPHQLLLDSGGSFTYYVVKIPLK
jgi:mannose-6-phosphate isomerase-like protein (cupin superfamily)